MGKFQESDASWTDAYIEFLDRHGTRFDKWLEAAGLQEVGSEDGKAIVVITGLAGPILLTGIVLGAVGVVCVIGAVRVMVARR